MRRSEWIAGRYSARPAGKPDECFYCHAPLGQPHKEGCVIRVRTVVVRVEIELPVAIPEDWDAEQIEYFMEDCALFDRIEDMRQRTMGRCTCDLIKQIEYVREATPEDEEYVQLHVSGEPG